MDSMWTHEQKHQSIFKYLYFDIEKGILHNIFTGNIKLVLLLSWKENHVACKDGHETNGSFFSLLIYLIKVISPLIIDSIIPSIWQIVGR